ncbi:hypothetical protein, partial [Vibrio fluvialis]|uniref:hypothetical protein n=1 Tax=Vibrio fluvialis TaxID=676 RepID=UPI001EEC27B6
MSLKLKKKNSPLILQTHRQKMSLNSTTSTYRNTAKKMRARMRLRSRSSRVSLKLKNKAWQQTL